MFELFFISYGKFYEQCDGLAMGSPLGPTLANVFMYCFDLFDSFLIRFIDDTVLLF